MSVHVNNKEDSLLVTESKQVLEALGSLTKLPKELREGKSLGTLLAALESAIALTAVATLERQAQVARKRQAARALRMLLSEVRSAVRGLYGGDSEQLAEVGGTRRSARRKRPVRARVTKVTPATHGAPATPEPTPSPPS